MSAATAAPPARRLVLSAAELALLVARTGVTLPAGFTGAPVDDSALREAATALAERGVVEHGCDDPLDCQPVAAITANLAVLAAPVVSVQVEVSVQGRGLRAVYAVAGPLGASLFALADGAIELSLFDARTLGRELIRAVPEPGDLVTPQAMVGRALGGTAVQQDRLAGRLPLAALTEYGPVRIVAGTHEADSVVAGLGLDAEQARLAGQVAARTSGVLRCLVVGAAGGGVAVGQVVWLATDDGWVGLHPEPDGEGRRMVELRPVAREEIGTWLAPYVAEILEASGDRA
jgi:hypothetical protein